MSNDKLIEDLTKAARDSVNEDIANAISKALEASTRPPSNDNDWLKPNPDYVSEKGWKTYSDNASGIPNSKGS